MQQYSISIAMCTFNGDRYLEEQLDSFAFQTRLPDEIIICDDGSSDNTLSIIEKFSNKASFPVRIFTNKIRLGSTKNFEKAISYCKGDIIALSDQDDVWFSNKLGCIENIFQTSPKIGAVVSNGEVVNELLQPLNYRLWDSFGFDKYNQNIVRAGKALDVLLKRNVVTGAAMAFKSDLRNIYLPIPSSWVHDGWIALLISFFAELVITPEPLIKYRTHSEQQIGGQKKNLLDKIKMSRRTGADDYSFIAMQYCLAYERLLNFITTSEDQNTISKFKSKIEHVQARANIYSLRSHRLKIISQELSKNRYHLYSRGLTSFFKDLLYIAITQIH